MSATDYRSYLIRIRRRRRDGDAQAGDTLEATAGADVSVRADVEDLLGGSRARLDGERARLLAAGLEALVRRIDEPEGDAPSSG